MSQYDFGTIDPNTKSGTALATDLNSWRNALHSTHSGSTAPSYTTAAMLWADTTSANYELKMYDGAQWIPVAVIDATNNVARVALDAAETSYITSTTNAQIRHVIANTTIATMRSTGLQFNIAAPVISDSNANELFSFTTAASAVNHIDIANAATGGSPILSTAGGDTDIDLVLTTKGTGLTRTITTSPATNTVIDVARLEARSTGTPATGIGAGLLFAVETAASVYDIGARIEAITTDVTSGSEDFDLVFKVMAAGAAATERMRINASGNVGIGTNAPTLISTGITTLDLKGNSASQTDRSGGVQFTRYDGTVGMQIYHGDGANSIVGLSTYPTLFFTNGAERARIDSGGIFSVGCTELSTTSTTDTGAQMGSSGGGNFFRASNTPLVVMRQTNDGTLVDLRQGGASEGSISVSGTTVSYNGGHLSRWAQFPDNSRPELLKGTVMSNLDQMSNWDNEDNEQLNCVQVSAVEGDANVAGVFVDWDSTDDGYNDILLAMTGDMVIRIAGGTTVQRGDLLMSAGDGTAKPQGDDIVRSKTIAKVTSTHVSHTYADGSYAVPCVLMAC